MEKKLIGSWGENVAKKYLEGKGYQILEKNWRYGHKELDIIAFKDIVIGLEIKVRKNDRAPRFTILKATQVGNLRTALLAYCRLKHASYQKSRLDLIVISPSGKCTVKIHHYYQI